MKFQVFSRVDHLEWLVGSYTFCDMCKRSDFLCCVGSTSLIVRGELNQIVVASRRMFTPMNQLTWANVGGCYNASHPRF